MVVTKSKLDEVLSLLSKETALSVDTETTGLWPHKGDVLFSIIVGSANGIFYFNFEEYEDIAEDQSLNTPECWAKLRTFFISDPFKTWFLHNSKFDLAFLRKEGIEIAGKICDTKTRARLLWNDHMKYSLADCVKRDIGLEKSDAVEKYVKEHKLYEDISHPHHSTKERKVFYHKVPFDIITEYGLIDADITYKLGMHQERLLDQESQSRKYPPLRQVADLEQRLVRPIFEMQWHGVKIDRAYCEKAIEAEGRRAQLATQKFKQLTGRDFLDSNKLFSEVFAGMKVPTTPKGNASFDKDSLTQLQGNPIAESILEYRDAKKQADYFHGFLYYADSQDVIHPDFLADGTSSGRFSSRSPNLQNLSKPDEKDESRFEVRGAFIPRPNTKFYIMDYQAQEYRLLVDLSGAKKKASEILAGADVHAETAKVAGVTRQEAKITVFSTIYGAGVNKIAETLKCTPSRAAAIKSSILDAVPEFRKFIRNTIEHAEIYKKVHSWFGHVYRFPNRNDCYRAPNYVIQGGCAAITKIAIANCHEFLTLYKSRLVLTVHDSIIFEIADGEEHLVPELRKIMIEAYPHKILPMDVSIEVGSKNMSDTEKL